MSIINDSINLFEAERLVESQRPKNVNDRGDFEGLVTATWLGLTSTGLGRVAYQDKEYKTVPLGVQALPSGSKVLVNFSRGIYYSTW